jgi:CelD/BcsL family acetyltransferase involved in cellulose biosynthesis
MAGQVDATGSARVNKGECVNGEPVQVEVLRDARDLMEFRPQWDRLLAATPSASPYADFDWYDLTRQHFERKDAVRVGVLRDAAGVLAIVPLRLSRDRVGPLRVKMLKLAGGGWSPQSTCIVADRAADAAVLHILLDHLNRRDRWAFCRLSRVPEGSPLTSEGLAPGLIALDVVRNCMGATVLIPLPPTWEEYRAGLSQAHRKNISRRINGLERKDTLVMVRIGPGDVLEEGLLETLLSDSLDVSRRSWQASADEGRSISDPDTIPFFREASQRMAAKGMLDLSVMYLGKRPLSFIWGLGRHGTTTIAKLAFDGEYGDYSPGLVHLAKHISDSIERKITCVDFGHEFADYKRKWGKQSLPVYDIWCYRRTLLGAVLRRWRHRRTPPAPPTHPEGGGQERMRSITAGSSIKAITRIR